METASTLIDKRFVASCETPSDIFMHVDTLRSLARFCDSVLELGVRSAVSSWGFIKGLVDDKGRLGEKKFLMNDIEFHPNIDVVRTACEGIGLHFAFIQGNDLEVDIPLDRVDMVFIDTWHIYGQLRRELAKYAPLAQKFIVMHDTEVDGAVGESIRMGHDIPTMAKKFNIPEHEIALGLMPAVQEFLQAHPEWYTFYHSKKNNGLTVLARIPPVKHA